jgi:conjugative relaxase-like TrwC/TraI family protein
MMTCHVLHAGDGYRYLTRQVASADASRPAGQNLTDYYTAGGNPPGIWMGSGCADLSIVGEVTEEHMMALFGEGLRPDANEFIADRRAKGDTITQAITAARLGRRFAQHDKNVPLLGAINAAYREFERAHGRRASVEERNDIKLDVARTVLIAQMSVKSKRPRPSREQVRTFLTNELGRARQPVSGFDLVFSHQKTGDLLWALGKLRVRPLPSKSFRIRWSSSDPTVREVVAQAHNLAVRVALAYGEQEAAFTRLGAGGIAQVRTTGFVATAFEHRDSRAGDPNLHTHVVVANRVLGPDGKWRTLDGQQLFKVAVSMSEVYNATFEQLLTELLGVRWVEVSRGAGKRPVREIEGMPGVWTKGFSRRRTQVEAGYDKLVADYVRRHGKSPSRSVQMKLAQQATLEDRPDKEELRSLDEQVSEWEAEARRMLPGVDIDAVIGGCLHLTAPVEAGAVDVEAIADRVIGVVSEQRSTWTVYHVRAEAVRQLKSIAFDSNEDRVAAVEAVVSRALGENSLLLSVTAEALPQLLLDYGESVFHRHGSELYTCQAILDAETRIVEASETRRGPVVTRRAWQAAVNQVAKGVSLNAGQRAMVEHLLTCGMAFARGIGPPGTGKSTAMRAVKQGWESTGGRIIGLAPSAASASVLGDELGVHADTIHSLIERYVNGEDIDVLAGDMLLIDESGMAGTLLVDVVREIAEECGAVVRAVGDHRQLPAVEAGGWFRLLEILDIPGIGLTEVHRFERDDEADAVLAFRVGDESAIPWYANNDRLIGGAGPAVLDQLYQDWQADIAEGHTAIMISDSADFARELSARAQLDRRAAGQVSATGVELHDGTVAGVGDTVVTRLNRRRLAVLGGKDYVKNGDLWQVEQRHRDGRLRLKHLRHGGRITLPAHYVKEHVELGYAATIHRSQGLTVDIARAFLTPTAFREAALVALSRGVQGNYAYLDTEEMLAVDEPETLSGELYFRNRETREAAEALRMILRREGAERSATEELRAALDAPYRLDNAVPEFVFGLSVYRGPDAAREAEEWVRRAVPAHADAVLADDAWPALAAVLHEVRDAGINPARLLARRAAERALVNDPTDPARSVAQVLHFRIVADMPTPQLGPHRPALLPGWVTTPPTAADDDAVRARVPAARADAVIDVGHWLRRRAEQIANRVHVLGERAAARPPVWADLLGDVPDDPAGREVWIVRAGQVAAYRERWQIPDHTAELLPGGHRGEQARARTWVQQFLASNPLPPPPAPSAADRLTARTESLRQRLDQLGRILAPRSGPVQSATTTPMTADDLFDPTEIDPDADPGPESGD